jgi:hypothetical protein
VTSSAINMGLPGRPPSNVIAISVANIVPKSLCLVIFGLRAI